MNIVTKIGINCLLLSGSRVNRLPSSSSERQVCYHMRVHDFASYIWCIWPTDTINAASDHPYGLDLVSGQPVLFLGIVLWLSSQEAI